MGVDEFDLDRPFDDDSDTFTMANVRSLLNKPKTAKVLSEVGVDAVGLVDYAEFVFQDTDHISFADFLDLLLQLRGANATKVKDIVQLRKFLSVELRRLQKTLQLAGACHLDDGAAEIFSGTLAGAPAPRV